MKMLLLKPNARTVRQEKLVHLDQPLPLLASYTHAQMPTLHPPTEQPATAHLLFPMSQPANLPAKLGTKELENAVATPAHSLTRLYVLNAHPGNTKTKTIKRPRLARHALPDAVHCLPLQHALIVFVVLIKH